MTDLRELLTRVRRGELSPTAGLERLRTRGPGASEAVAIVGMACRLPGADDVAGFWSLLAGGGDAIVEVPADRWALAGFYDPDPAAVGRSYGRWGGFLRGLRHFDAAAFGLTAADAALLDPQQRLFLEVGAAALDHAGRGLAAAELPVGVFVGARMSSYSTELRAAAPADALGRMAILGHSQNYIAAWLSDRLDLGGPSLVVDTACSSSLVALHLACESLRRGECGLALAGGVDLLLSPGFHLSLAAAKVLSPSGRCRVFDRDADGYVPGEGAGAVVLRRLDDALRDGDTIHAVIRGSAMNNDGRTAGITTPNAAAQRAVIERALAAAGVDAGSIGYVEAHGTGTAIGDPIEVRALAEVFASVRERGVVGLGSVKSNIGHLHSAAGVASLLKVVLALVHGALPPTLHCHEPNPRFRFADSPFAPNLTLRPWARRGGPRRAGVSAFGFGGTNCHVIVEEAPEAGTRARPAGARALLVSAGSGEGLRQVAREVAAGLRGGAAAEDVALTLHAGRRPQAHRLGVAGADAAALAGAIDAALAGGRTEAVGEVTRRRPPPLVFMFPGQGAQEPGMARELYARFPGFRAAIDRSAAIVGDRLGAPLQDVIFASSRAAMVRTELAQPAMFAVEVALAELWQALGLRPAAVIGHSLGEYAAACVAGALSLADGLELVLARGRRMAALPEAGTMAAILAPLAEVLPLVEQAPDEVAIAAINGPANTVIAGRSQRVATIVASLGARGVTCVPLRVSHAFHSPLMRPMVADFAAALARCGFAAPQVELISNVTGGARGDAPDAAYWLRHLLEPVRFADGVATLLAAGHRHFVEVGPGDVLARQVAALGPGCTFYRSWRGGRGDLDLVESAARLYVQGFALAPAALHAGGRRVPLPVASPGGEDLPIAAAEYLRWRAGAGAWRRGWEHAWPGSAEAEPVNAGRAGAERVGGGLRGPLSLSRSSALVADHGVFGAAVLAGAAQWSLALAARPGAGLRRVTMVRPLVLADAVHEVDVALAGDRFVVRSRVASGPWVTHSTGELASPGAAPPRVELAAIRERCPRVRMGAALYASLAGRGLVYGPSFCAVEEVRCGAREVVARLATGGELGPGALDGALQALAALAEAEGAVFLPFFAEAIDVWRAPAGPCFAVATIEPGQSEALLRCRAVIVDEDGEVCAAIGPLWLKRASAEDVARAVAAEGGASGLPRMFAPVWREANDGAAMGPPRGRWLVLAEGAARDGLVRALAGAEVVAVSAGEGFARREDGFVLRPGSAEDWAALASALGPGPLAGVAHAWHAGPVLTAAEELERGVYCLAALARGLAEPLARGPGVLWWISRAAQAAGGVEVAPTRAAALGLARAWVREQRGWALCGVDLEGEALAPALAEPARRVAGESALRGGRWLVRGIEAIVLAEEASPGATSVAVITGAAGALGSALAVHLAGRGWRRIALLSRRAPAEATLVAVRAAGAEVVARAVDVTERPAMERALAELRAAWGPISGVFHLAGTIDDGWLRERTREAIDRVLAPKLAAAAIVEATAQDGARVVLFASLAGVRGNLRQADYAAGNAFLDGLAHAARARGRMVSSVDWSLWGELGAGSGAALRAAAELEGLTPLPTAGAMAALDRVLAAGPVQVIVGDLDPARVFAVPGLPRERPTASRGARARALEATLTAEIAAVAGIPASELDPERTLLELGLDSAALVQLVQALEVRAGLPLYPTLLFEYPTIAALAAHFAEAHPDAFAATSATASAGAASGAEAPAGPRRARVVDDVGAPAGAGVRDRDIAIIGMAGRYPGAADLEAFWANLIAGVDSVGLAPAERWDHRAFDPDPRKLDSTYSKWGGFLADVDRFDPLFFQISPREAEVMDPQHRLFLEVAEAALEDAGYAGRRLAGGNGGVFVGITYHHYLQEMLRAGASFSSYASIGNTRAILPNRLSYFLDWHGPSLMVDTLCSSALVAIRMACDSLLRGECPVALAGAVNAVNTASYYKILARMGTMSPRGKCRPFDAGADGYVLGEGVGAVVLKPLARALADGDLVHAVIRGGAVNHDGKSQSLTAPNPRAHARLYTAAWADAEVDPGELGYVEAHGTGTPLGDPVEIAGLSEAIRARTQRRQFCAIGSVKSNLGHLEPAAGMAGLCKVVLAMQHGQIPPTLHFERQNPHIPFASSPFVVAERAMAWPPGRKLAGVSSFGIGGANAHLVVAEAPARTDLADDRAPCLVALSGRDPAALERVTGRLRAHLEGATVSLVDVAFTLAVGRGEFACRRALVAVDLADLRGQLAREFVATAVPGRPVTVATAGLGAEELALLAGWGVVAVEGGERVIEAAALAPARRLATAGELWAAGVPVALGELFAGRRRQRIGLPTYPFADQRYWYAPNFGLDPGATATGSEEAALVTPAGRYVVTWAASELSPGTPRRFSLARESTGSAGLAERGLIDPASRDLLLVRPGLDEVRDALRGRLAGRGLADTTVLVVTGGDREAAAIAGLMRTATLESRLFGGPTLRHVDLVDDDLAEVVAREAGASGPPEVRWRGGRRFVRELVPWAAEGPVSLALRGATILVVGGARGVGARLARWFAERGANLAILGEQPLPPGATEDRGQQEKLATLAGLRGLGVAVEYVAADVADADAVARALTQVRATLGPLVGVVFGAARLADGFLFRKTDAQWDAVLRPKVAGALVLDRLTRGDPLQFFVLLASMTGVTGNPGQADYGAANSWQDQFAAERTGPGRTLAIDWSLWAETGNGVTPEVLAALRSRGLEPLAPEAAVAAFASLLESRGAPQVVVADITPTGLAAINAMFADGSLDVGEAPTRAAEPTIVAPATEDEREAVEALLRSLLAARLKLAPHQIDRGAPLSELGVDSFLITELVDDLARVYGEKIHPSTVLEHPTLAALALHLASTRVRLEAAPVPAAAEVGPGPEIAAEGSAISAEGSAISAEGSAISAEGSAISAEAGAPALVVGEVAVAVVGMACRFPGAPSLAAYQEALERGVSAIGPAPWERFGMAAPDDPSICQVGGFLPDEQVVGFDPGSFGIDPRSALLMDPQQRLFLEIAAETLEHAAVAGDGHTRTGVFVGARTSHYWSRFMAELTAVAAEHPDLATQRAAVVGTLTNYIAAHVAKSFDLRGPALSVETACSSSLVATHLAVEAIASGQCERAIAGGVDLKLTGASQLLLSRMRALAQDGKSRVFDAEASGFIPGEGAGAVLLERLDLAQARGATIYAVIVASACNNDGKTMGLTTPSLAGQLELLTAAWRGIDPATLGYVEAHGTGTGLGDPIEFKALATMLRRATGRSGITGLGSVKSAIGHLDTAAGIAGLIKVVLSLWRRRLYPTLECSTPNPRFDIERSPLWIVDRAAPFAAPAGGGPRRAGVSALGLGGTNAHLVLEEAAAAPRDAVMRTPQVLALSAATDSALARLAQETAQALRSQALRIDDIAVSANLGRGHRYRSRLAVVGATREALASALESATPRSAAREGSAGPRIGFVFPGQGSPRYGAGQAIAGSEPAFARALEAVDAAARRVTNTPIMEVILGRVTPRSTRQSHLAWVGIELAIAQLWQSYGVAPDLVVGHSLGEYAASAFAGALTVEAALGLVAERAELFDTLAERGAMLAVMAEANVITPLLPPEVVVAAYNGPTSTVLAGVASAVDRLAQELDRRDILWAKLRVSHAVHSPTLDPIVPALTRVSERTATRAPAIPLWSTVTGERVGVLARDHWSRHARGPVRFDAAIRAVLPRVDLFVEMGPGVVNTRFIESLGGACLPTLRKDAPERASLLETLARLYEAGAPIAWARVCEGDGGARRIALPATPRERGRFWPTSVATRPGRPGPVAPAERLSPMLDRCVSIGDRRVIYEKLLVRGEAPVIGEHSVLGHTILPAVGYWEPMLVAAEHACARPVTALREIAIHRPLIVTDLPHMLEIEVTWTEAEDGCEVAVYGRVLDDTPPAQVQRHKHVTATAVFGAVEASRSLDRAAIEARCPVKFARGATYTEAYMQSSGVHYGPFFRTLETIAASPTEVIAGLSVPTLDGWRAHAGLLDGALQTWAAFRLQIEGDAAGDAAFLPMFVEEVVFCAPLTRTISAYSFLATPLRADMEVVTGEVQIADDRGALAVVVRGLMLKRVPLRSLEARAPVWVQAWQRHELPVGARPEGRWLVIGEDEPGAARALEAAGATAIRVTGGPRFVRRSATSFRVNVESEADLDQLLAQVLPLAGIVDTTAASGSGEWELTTALADLVAAPQAWLRAALRCELREFVWCFASVGGSLVRDGERPDPALSLSAAVSRVIRGEHAKIRAFSLDLEADAPAAGWLGWLAAPPADAAATRGGEHYQRQLVPTTLTPSRRLPVARGEAAIVTGGGQGLGLEVTRWLLGLGVRVVVLGRSERPERLPAAATYVRGDVGEREDVERLARASGLVTAIFHVAGAIREVEGFAGKSVDTIAGVLAPKVQGLANLCAVFPEVHVTSFSSIAAQSPELARGLGDYAIANAFLDAAVIARRARGLPGLSVAWTHWSEAGRTAGDGMTGDALAARGIGSLTTSEGLGWLKRALESEATAVVVMPRVGREAPAMREPTPPTSAPAPAKRAAGAATLERPQVLAVLVQQVADALKVEPSRVAVDTNFMELGIDSLALLGFARSLERELGIKLYPSVYFEYPTIQRLAEHIAAGGPAETPAATPEAAVADTSTGPVRLRSYHYHDRIIAWRWRVGGALDTAVLARAVESLVARHELLRVALRFEADEMVLVPVDVPQPFPLAITTLVDRPRAEQVEVVERLSAAARHRDDRSSWPLFNMRVIHLAEDEHVVLGSITHAICDGWSLMVLGYELEAVYAAMRAGREPGLPPVQATIRRWADWQQQQRQTAGQQAANLYWDEVFAEPLPPQRLPTDFAREDRRTNAVAIATQGLDAGETELLRRAATRHGTTLYVLVMAALIRRLYLWTGVSDRVVGMPTAGRSGTLPGLEGLLGCVVNPLLVRVRVAAEDDFAAVLTRTQAACQGALRHGEYVYEGYRAPAIAFTFPQVAGQAPRADAWQVEQVWNEIGVDDVDVIFLAGLERDADGERVGLRWTWPAELFRPETLAALGAGLCADLRALGRGEALV